MTIPPHEQRSLGFTVLAPREEGTFRKFVTLYTDVSTQPDIELEIEGTVTNLPHQEH